MKNIKLTFASICMLFLLVGCSSKDKDMNIVKNGVMNFNKTLTVGEAFDNWNNCQKQKSGWESFKTENGIRVVQFTCFAKGVKEYTSQLKNESEEQGYKDNHYLDVAYYKEIFQFTINQDNSFQIASVQNKILWLDGRKFSFQGTPINDLQEVYNNKILFNVSRLNEIGLGERGVGALLLTAYQSAKYSQ